MMIDVEIPSVLLKDIIWYAKTVKATFTVVDPNNVVSIYGCSGEGFSGREAHVGSVKYISNINNEIVTKLHMDLYPIQYGFVVYTKDLKAIEKLVLSKLDTIKVILHVRIIDNCMYDVRSISVIDGDNIIELETFRAGRFFDAYSSLCATIDGSWIPEKRLDDDPAFLNILSRVAKEGVFKYMIGDSAIFINNTLLNVNKGDVVLGTHTSEVYPRILLKVIKKKLEIDTIFRIIPLR